MEPLLQVLDVYRSVWCSGKAAYPTFAAEEELSAWERLRGFVESTPTCFEKTNKIGHMTGSALITNPTLTQVLLTLHAKLKIWLQLGGHAEGDPRLEAVAMREAHEESGLEALSFLPYEAVFNLAPLSAPLPFDLDVHRIPANPREDAHEHFDVRYLIVADSSARLVISDESHDLRWFSLDEARRVTNERSMLRQFAKLEYIRQRLKP